MISTSAALACHCVASRPRGPYKQTNMVPAPLPTAQVRINVEGNMTCVYVFVHTSSSSTALDST